MTLNQAKYLEIHFFTITITNLNYFEIPLMSLSQTSLPFPWQPATSSAEAEGIISLSGSLLVGYTKDGKFAES
jgi:hypothetical protein